MIWDKFKSNKQLQVRHPVVEEEEKECQFISGRSKSPRSISLMLSHILRCETEVKMFRSVGGEDYEGTHTQQKSGRKLYFYCNHFRVNICVDYVGGK